MIPSMPAGIVSVIGRPTSCPRVNGKEAKNPASESPRRVSYFVTFSKKNRIGERLGGVRGTVVMIFLRVSRGQKCCRWSGKTQRYGAFIIACKYFARRDNQTKTGFSTTSQRMHRGPSSSSVFIQLNSIALRLREILTGKGF